MADTDDTATMAPPSRRATMCRAPSRIVSMAPSRLTAITRRHSSIVMSRMLDPFPDTPALAKTLSTLPRAATVAANDSTIWASSRTSHCSTWTLPPMAASCSPAAAFLAGLVPQMATAAPARARPDAIPSPMPLLPPVTRATWPVRSDMLPTVGGGVLGGPNLVVDPVDRVGDEDDQRAGDGADGPHRPGAGVIGHPGRLGRPQQGDGEGDADGGAQLEDGATGGAGHRVAADGHLAHDGAGQRAE